MGYFVKGMKKLLEKFPEKTLSNSFVSPGKARALLLERAGLPANSRCLYAAQFLEKPGRTCIHTLAVKEYSQAD